MDLETLTALCLPGAILLYGANRAIPQKLAGFGFPKIKWILLANFSALIALAAFAALSPETAWRLYDSAKIEGTMERFAASIGLCFVGYALASPVLFPALILLSVRASAEMSKDA